MPGDLNTIVPLTITENDLAAWDGYLEPHDLHAIARQMWQDLERGQTYGQKSVLYPHNEELRASRQYAGALATLHGERLGWKLSALSAVGPKYAAMKIVGANALNRHMGLKRSQSTIILFDKFSMRPLCLMAGSKISAARTGTYASITAEIFFKPPEHFTVFIFGTGPIARWACQLLAATKGRSVAQLFVRARSYTSAQHFAAALTHLPFPITPVADDGELATADFVITATNAQSPVFARGQLGKNAVVLHLGGDETPVGHIEDVLSRGVLVCDDIAMVSNRATSSLALFSKDQHGSLQVIAKEWGVKELAHLMGKATPPLRPALITCVGLPSLDLYVAQHVYETFLARRATKAP